MLTSHDFLLRADNDFVFVGYSNGILRLYSLGKHSNYDADPSSSFHDTNNVLPWSTTNYWTISLHSPKGGSIREIFTIETQQEHLLISCGEDGGIFAHKINQVLDDIYQATMDENVCIARGTFRHFK